MILGIRTVGTGLRRPARRAGTLGNRGRIVTNTSGATHPATPTAAVPAAAVAGLSDAEAEAVRLGISRVGSAYLVARIDLDGRGLYATAHLISGHEKTNAYARKRRSAITDRVA
jgi:hypothetical protein